MRVALAICDILPESMGVSMSRLLVCLLALVLFAPGQEQSSTAVPLRILVLNSAEESARIRAELETALAEAGVGSISDLSARTAPSTST